MNYIKLENLSKEKLNKICDEISDAFISENDVISLLLDKNIYKEYIKICTEIYYKSGHLYTIDHTGYISFFTKVNPIKLRYHFYMAYLMFKRLGFKNVNKVMKTLKNWNGYSKLYKDDNYMILEMIAIPLKYQHQGKMKQLISIVFNEADNLNIKTVLDTDTSLKCQKYIKCGMHLVKTSKLTDNVNVYVLEK